MTHNHSINKRNQVRFTGARVRIITREGRRQCSAEAWVSVQSYIFIEQGTFIKHTQDTFFVKVLKRRSVAN